MAGARQSQLPTKLKLKLSLTISPLDLGNQSTSTNTDKILWTPINFQYNFCFNNFFHVFLTGNVVILSIILQSYWETLCTTNSCLWCGWYARQGIKEQYLGGIITILGEGDNNNTWGDNNNTRGDNNDT